jgi:hypothetical protein
MGRTRCFRSGLCTSGRCQRGTTTGGQRRGGSWGWISIWREWRMRGHVCMRAARLLPLLLLPLLLLPLLLLPVAVV